MSKLLILFSHPRLEQSRANAALLKAIPESPDIYLHDLYEVYPDFNIDIGYEQELLLAHDIIVWHHPFYWYSAPPLMKQWIDLVLEYGWAYGVGGDQLQGKKVFNAITSGGKREVYQPSGYNRFTIREFLRPFEQTATLCHMQYLPPFAVQGSHKLDDATLAAKAQDYRLVLQMLTEDAVSPDELVKYEFFNDWILDQQLTKHG